jgi:hypothetical protein
MLHLCLTILSLWTGPVIAGSVMEPAWLRVEIAMAEEGFMCPFLTPLFKGILEDKGADWVICRPQQSQVIFCTPLALAQDQEGYIDWLTDLGYEEEHVTFLAFDTLSVMPSIPAP